MKSRGTSSVKNAEMLKFVHWIPVFVLLIFCPDPSMGADIDVLFQQIGTFDGSGNPKTEFFPGEEIQVRVGLSVLRSTGNPFVVRLRVTGDGWHEIPIPQPLVGLGSRVITFGGPGQRLYVSGEAIPGKVNLLVDVFSENESVSLQGRRHEYLTIRCPEGLPEGLNTRLKVGRSPFDMALTASERYLYVTSREDLKVTVIDVETKAVVAEIEEEGTIGFPTGVAPSPNGTEMLVADGAFQVIHVIDADDHVVVDTIPLNEIGEFGQMSPGDLAVHRGRNEAYVTDTGRARIFVVDLASLEVREVSLTGSPNPPPAGLTPIRLLLDPQDPRFMYVLSGGLPLLNEVIKLDVSGVIVDFAQLSTSLDPSSWWPAWSMALNPMTDEIYVVVNPGRFESTYPTIQSKIYALPKNWLGDPGRREFHFGSSLWELVVRQDGRFVYAIDSYRGEILVIDMSTETELYGCAIPVPPGGRLLRPDPSRNRLFVGNSAPGYVDIVE
jgi:YVTN family beta-propeller protein